jgi:D-mannonate dehydratase
MLRRFADRIHFLHLRTTFREQNDPLIFHEAPHLTGDVDMFEVVKAVVEESPPDSITTTRHMGATTPTTTPATILGSQLALP